MPTHTVVSQRLLLATVFVISVVVSSLFPYKLQAAPVLPSRFIRISTPNVSQSAEYTVGITLNEVTTQLGSIELLFCDNSPIIVDVCIVPPGLDVSTAVLANETGNTGFSITDQTPSRILISRTASLPANATSTYRFTGVTNPSAQGSYYLRILTYESEDGTGPIVEEGGAVFSMNGGLNLATEVPPYLKLCASVSIVNYDCATATSFIIDFGELSKINPKTATSELVVATNAGSGFNISISGTTLTSGNNVINALSAGGASLPGTAQFGINLRSNTNPVVGSEPIGPGIASPTAGYNNPNVFRFASADVIASGSGATDNKKFTVAYIANIDVNQQPGVYATTITYIALANF